MVFVYEKAEVHYFKSGHGKKVLLAFHGFGQSKQHFLQFSKALGKQYTIYSFDLFYHGLSFWHEGEKPLKKEFWKNLIHQFLIQQEISHFSLAGYSMGGKFALAILEAFPERVDRLMLIAPDGIKNNFWYTLATYPSRIRKIFRAMIVKPVYFNNLVSFFSKVGIINKSLVKFASFQMNTRKKRRQVYYSWVVFRLLKFEIIKIATLINRHSIQVDIYLGKYDKMITKKHMNKLINNLHDYKLYILESGHNNLINAVAEHLNNEV